MKYREILIEQLKSFPFFDKGTICQLSEQYELKQNTIDSYIRWSLKYEYLIQLKKGMYVTTDFFKKNQNDISYTFYLANIMRSPSYVTSWTALQYYDLATETININISVTPKITKNYTNKVGNFRYHSIKDELFSGFYLVKGTSNFFIASPSKALFDLIYFKTHQLKGMSLEKVEALIDDLRIDIDEMDKKEQNNFYKIIKNYLK